MFMIKRIQNHNGKESIQKIVDSLYTSKLRLGLPLYGKIKWNQLDTQEKWFNRSTIESKQDAKIHEREQTER